MHGIGKNRISFLKTENIKISSLIAIMIGQLVDDGLFS